MQHHAIKSYIAQRLAEEPIFPPGEHAQPLFGDWAVTFRFYAALHVVSAYVRFYTGLDVSSHEKLFEALWRMYPKIRLDRDFVENYSKLFERSREARYDDPEDYEDVNETYGDTILEEVDKRVEVLLDHKAIRAFLAQRFPEVPAEVKATLEGHRGNQAEDLPPSA